MYDVLIVYIEERTNEPNERKTPGNPTQTPRSQDLCILQTRDMPNRTAQPADPLLFVSSEQYRSILLKRSSRRLLCRKPSLDPFAYLPEPQPVHHVVVSPVQLSFPLYSFPIGSPSYGWR